MREEVSQEMKGMSSNIDDDTHLVRRSLEHSIKHAEEAKDHAPDALQLAKWNRISSKLTAVLTETYDYEELITPPERRN